MALPLAELLLTFICPFSRDDYTSPCALPAANWSIASFASLLAVARTALLTFNTTVTYPVGPLKISEVSGLQPMVYTTSGGKQEHEVWLSNHH